MRIGLASAQQGEEGQAREGPLRPKCRRGKAGILQQISQELIDKKQIARIDMRPLGDVQFRHSRHGRRNSEHHPRLAPAAFGFWIMPPVAIRSLTFIRIAALVSRAAVPDRGRCVSQRVI
jgi:hypothetical protein